MPPPLQIDCPFCGQPHATGSEQTGDSIQCTHCGKLFIVGARPEQAERNADATSYPQPDKNAEVSKGRTKTIPAIVIGCIIIVFGLIVTPSVIKVAGLYHRVESANNLKKIGEAINLYCNDNRGRHPPDLGTLVDTQGSSADTFLYPRTFTFPWSGNSPPSNFLQLTNNERAQWINQHTDYIYVGAALTSGSDPEMIVAYEKDKVHGPGGTNALFADGHVERLTQLYVHRKVDEQQSNSPATKPAG